MKFSIVLLSAWFAVLSIATPIPSFDDDLLFIRSDDGPYRSDDVIDFLEPRGVKSGRSKDGPRPARTPHLQLTIPQGQVPQHHAGGTGHSNPPSHSAAPSNTPVAPQNPQNPHAPDFSWLTTSHFL